MNKEELDKKSMLELLELKEYYRTEYGLYIENDMGERGTANRKTKPYWGSKFLKRVSSPRKKGHNWNACIVFGTFDTYREALVSSLEKAEFANSELNKHNKKQ